MNFCFGPMSKNVVDTIILFSLEHSDIDITFIPSRRQIEYDGGYVNHWNTFDFVKYVKEKNNKIIIERDHCGPNQGLLEDDGMTSISDDAKYLDIIHIDPWKKYYNIDDGIAYTIKMINHCYSINSNLLYEICTEEAIRPFTVDEIEYIILNLQQKLTDTIFNKIKYLVIQCGTKLSERQNTGTFDETKLSEMLVIANKYNMTAKEHNGDWVSLSTIKRKYELGLTCINIAPEFGEIESKVILNRIKQNSSDDYDKLYKLCFESGKWKKWVTLDFDCNANKDDIILICGHYNFTNKDFIEIKSKYPGIDHEINNSIYDKLLELYQLNNIYSVRKQCIFCKNDEFEMLFEHSNYRASLSLSVYSELKQVYYMPYNVQICKTCNTFQNKYIGNLSIIYDNNHVDNFGTTKTEKHKLLTNFIIENKHVNGVIEIGSCNGILARNILENISIPYTIIEPSYTGDSDGINIIETFFENVDVTTINANTIIMSDVFEHFYNPTDILDKIKDSKNIQYIILSHPDFDYSIKNNFLTNLNCEHTFLIQHNFLFAIFEKYGFKLNKRYDYVNYSLFLEFERVDTQIILDKQLTNTTLYYDSKKFFNNIITIVDNINKFIDENPIKNIYIWPSSVHSITLFTYGLKYNKLAGILDNSPNKIGKYLYGYNLLCSSFNDIININDPNNCIIISGAGNYIKELKLNNTCVYYLQNFYNNNNMGQIYISLGWDCGPAMFAVNNSLRKTKAAGYMTCPFDLMNTNYDGIVDFFKDDFIDLLNPKFIELKTVKTSCKYLNYQKNDKIIINTKYNFIFNHESPNHGDLHLHENWANGPYHFCNNNFEEFFNRYNNRLQNFKNYLNSGQKIIFVNAKINNNYDSCKNLFDIIKNKYPNLDFDFHFIEEPEHRYDIYNEYVKFDFI
jgi:hypothetical protein